MRIGFTGTKEGMTDQQALVLYDILKGLEISEAHHGDCVGADSEFHVMCIDLGIPVHIHPPTNSYARAFCENAAKVHPKKPYLERNKDIVNVSDAMFATPKENEEQLRSGTWATIRYTRKTGKKLTIIPRMEE